MRGANLAGRNPGGGIAFGNRNTSFGQLGGLNRGNIGAGLNRGNIGAGLNRGNIGAGLNRGNIGAGLNRGNIGVNRFASTNINNVNVNRISNTSFNRGSLGRQGGFGNPYMAYHQNWMHGNWNGNYCGNRGFN